MKKYYLCATFLLSVCTISAQMSGVEIKSINPGGLFKSYEVVYFKNKPAVSAINLSTAKSITGKSSIRIESEYWELLFLNQAASQSYFTNDSLLSAVEIASREAWYGGFPNRNKNGTPEERQKQFGYRFDGALRGLLSKCLTMKLQQKYLLPSEPTKKKYFISWSGTADQFKIKSTYEEFLEDNLLSEIKSELEKFNMPKELIYIAYGVVKNFDFNTKKISLYINTDHVIFPEPIKQNAGTTLICDVEVDEEKAEELLESKNFRALLNVKPVPLEIDTRQGFVNKIGKDFKALITELSNTDIMLIGYDTENELFQFDASNCQTR